MPWCVNIPGPYFGSEEFYFGWNNNYIMYLDLFFFSVVFGFSLLEKTHQKATVGGGKTSIFPLGDWSEWSERQEPADVQKAVERLEAVVRALEARVERVELGDWHRRKHIQVGCTLCLGFR